jgi:transcriptional antiterminator
MMTLLQPPPSVLSDPQRRCHLLLTLCLPGQTVTPQVIARLNGVDEAVVHQDIADARHEIRENYRLNILTQPDGSYRIEGTALDRRLCLLHWLRRGLRLCPDFVRHQFAPALKQELRQQGISRALYDDTNLQALVNLCSRRLQRQFTPGDNQFLNLYLQFCLTQHQQGHIPPV